MAKASKHRRSDEVVSSGITLGNLMNLGGIPLITAIVTLSGFYYVTNDKLVRYGEEIKAVNSKVEASAKVVSDKRGDDDTARAKIREDFLKSQMETAQGIAKLDTRLAVSETQQKLTNDQLQKISDSLQRIVAFPTPSKR